MSDIIRKLQAGIQALEAIKARPDDPESKVSREEIEQTLQTYKKLEAAVKESAEAGISKMIEEQGSATDITGKYCGYTPEKLLAEAYTDYEAENPKAFAEKMSFAVALSLKRFFLSHKVLLSSDKCYKFFAISLFQQSNSDKDKDVIFEGWHAFEKLQLFACGGLIRGIDFLSLGEDIKAFLSLLSEIELKKEALKEILNKLEKGEDEIGVVAMFDEKPVNLCEEEFTYDHLCY